MIGSDNPGYPCSCDKKFTPGEILNFALQRVRFTQDEHSRDSRQGCSRGLLRAERGAAPGHPPLPKGSPGVTTARPREGERGGRTLSPQPRSGHPCPGSCGGAADAAAGAGGAARARTRAAAAPARRCRRRAGCTERLGSGGGSGRSSGRSSGSAAGPAARTGSARPGPAGRRGGGGGSAALSLQHRRRPPPRTAGRGAGTAPRSPRGLQPAPAPRSSAHLWAAPVP